MVKNYSHISHLNGVLLLCGWDEGVKTSSCRPVWSLLHRAPPRCALHSRTCQIRIYFLSHPFHIVQTCNLIAIIITLSKHELPRPGSNKRPPNDPTPGNVDRRAFQTQGTLLSWDLVKVSSCLTSNLSVTCVWEGDISHIIPSQILIHFQPAENVSTNAVDNTNILLKYGINVPTLDMESMFLL